MMHKRAGLIAALTTVLVVAGGCGPETVVPERGQLAVAAAATADAGTMRMQGTFTLVSPMFDSTMTLEGVADLVAEAVHMTMTMDGPEFGRMTAEFIMIDGFQYTRGEGAPGQPGVDGQVWQRQPLPEGVSGWADPTGVASPAEMIGLLRDLGVPVEQVGTEQVRAVGTTHYRIEATAEELMRAQPEEAAQQAQEQLPAELDLSAMPMVMEVWVDGDDLVRRMRMETDMTAIAREMLGEAGETRSLVDMEFYDFGVAAEISAPPEDQVVDYDPMAGPFPSDHPEVELDAGFDTFTDSVTVEIESEPAARRPEGVPDGFPEEFPFHPAAAVLEADEAPDRYELRLWVLTFGEMPLDEVVAFHDVQLPAHGWEVTGRSGELWRQRFDITGHGWTGSIDIEQAADSTEVTVTVTLTR